MQQRFGGSLAPPLSVEDCEKYMGVAKEAHPQVAEAMATLAALVIAHKEQCSPSTAKGTPHKSGTGLMVPLYPDTVKTLDPHMPWPEELKMMGEIFDKIDPVEEEDLRNAAHHLLWYANELNIGREPMTCDLL